jgi:sulfur-oxidizing protein SoxY
MSTRRDLLLAGAALAVLPSVRATPLAMATAIRNFTGDAAVTEGRVKLDIAPLVENGNAVPIGVSVDSPMSATDHVDRIAIFNERNPLPEVASFELGPANGRAQVGTRIRLATSQKLVAIARTNDGRFWRASVDVVVTLAACIET